MSAPPDLPFLLQLGTVAITTDTARSVVTRTSGKGRLLRLDGAEEVDIEGALKALPGCTAGDARTNHASMKVLPTLDPFLVGYKGRGCLTPWDLLLLN